MAEHVHLSPMFWLFSPLSSTLLLHSVLNKQQEAETYFSEKLIRLDKFPLLQEELVPLV